MCLFNNARYLKQLLSKQEIICYKVLNYKNGKLRSQIYNKVWRIGCNLSSRKSSKRVGDGISVDEGIYVYLKKPTSASAIIVKLKGLTENLIASDGNLAVFTKVFLSKEEFDKAKTKGVLNCCIKI